jgi:hypothetical protein
MAQECCVEIQFGAHDSSIVHLEQGQLLKPAHQALSFETAVGLDIPDDQVDPFGAGRARGIEHGVGLTDARRGAEKELQAPSIGAADRL